MHPHIEEKKDDYDDDVIASTSTTKADAPHHPHHTITSSNQPNNETNKSRPLLLLLCATGITSCYLWYGTVQEHLFQIDNNKGGDDKQSITLFLLATGTFSSFLLALVWIVIGPLLSRDYGQVQDNGRLNHPLLALTSITYLSTMAASNESLHYVSYPTCVLAKSSKLIPTMVVGWLVDKYRSYWRIGIQQNNNSSTSSSTNHKGINGMEWLGAALITIGILSFQYIQLQKQSNDSSHPHGSSDGEDKEEKGDSPYGLALLGLSLFMDGLLGACQSTLKQTHHSSSSSTTFRPPSAMETMLWINLYATLILIPCSYYAGQFQHGMSMLFPSTDTIANTQADHTSKLLLQLNLSASLGQVFIFLTIHHFSPLTCTTVTTTRKFFTILLSVYKFGHVLDVWQWCSVGLVFGGLYLEIVAKFIGEKGDGDGKKQKED
mmetsp:Transcript_31850/g.47601  ORF Transcript_31850/g.47601 Transcript_31850/m.47601 type:complete len:434 (-) Transcript_31850:159-1460(-)